MWPTVRDHIDRRRPALYVFPSSPSSNKNTRHHAVRPGARGDMRCLSGQNQMTHLNQERHEGQPQFHL
ncbi:hypothetical protein BaRGS_00015331, partial [Batillaria attramentaria]